MQKVNVGKSFLIGSVLLGCGFFDLPATAQQTGCPENFNVQESTISALQSAQSKGQISAQCLVQLYLQRINQYDKRGPKINSMLELNPDALTIAAQLDAERQAGKVRGPLHGIPIVIKGNIATHDRMTTTAGSVALAGSIPLEDAFLVKRLRAAGMIILGKANLTEFANVMAIGMPGGYSSQGGQTLNPYNPTTYPNGLPVLSPCGSSAGSGAATAANLTAVAIGTETSGSILCPSSYHSLVGIKTTLGLVSRSGVIPIGSAQDVAGPMTRTVADAAAVLNALASADPSDPVTLKSVGKVPPDYTAFLNLNGLMGARIGIARQYFYVAEGETTALIEQAIQTMRDLGAEIIDPVDISTFDQLISDSSVVLTYQFKQQLNAYLSTVGPTSPVKDLQEIILSNFRNSSVALKYGQELLITSQVQSGNTITKVDAAKDRLEDIQLARGGLEAALQNNQLDALIFPSSNGASVGAKAGYPTVIVPAGYLSNGRPYGVSFLGTAFSEARLIELAYAYEQATKLRRPPAATP